MHVKTEKTRDDKMKQKCKERFVYIDLDKI